MLTSGVELEYLLKSQILAQSRRSIQDNFERSLSNYTISRKVFLGNAQANSREALHLNATLASLESEADEHLKQVLKATVMHKEINGTQGRLLKALEDSNDSISKIIEGLQKLKGRADDEN